MDSIKKCHRSAGVSLTPQKSESEISVLPTQSLNTSVAQIADGLRAKPSLELGRPLGATTATGMESSGIGLARWEP